MARRAWRGAAWRGGRDVVVRRGGRGAAVAASCRRRDSSPAPKYVAPPMVTAAASRDASACDMDVGPTGIADRLTGGVLAARPPRARFGWRAGGARIQAVGMLSPHAASPTARLRLCLARSRGPALFWRRRHRQRGGARRGVHDHRARVRPERGRTSRCASWRSSAAASCLMLALNLLLLRHALGPLRELTGVRAPDRPARARASGSQVGGGDSEAAELAARVQRDARARSRPSAATSVAPRAARRRRASGCASRRSCTTAIGQIAHRRRRCSSAASRATSTHESRDGRDRGAARPPAAVSRRCGGSRAGCGLRRSTTSGWPAPCASSASASAEHSELEGRASMSSSGLPQFSGRCRARALPRRPGGADQCRPPRPEPSAREVRLELASGRPTLEVDDDGHGIPRQRTGGAAACAGCASAPC